MILLLKTRPRLGFLSPGIKDSMSLLGTMLLTIISLVSFFRVVANSIISVVTPSGLLLSRNELHSFFYKNLVYKNVEAEIWVKIKNNIRTLPSLNSKNHKEMYWSKAYKEIIWTFSKVNITVMVWFNIIYSQMTDLTFTNEWTCQVCLLLNEGSYLRKLRYSL